MKTIIGVCALVYISVYVNAAPTGSGSAAASAAFSASSSSSGSFGLPFLTFDNGNFGVNFGGYKASAGLGGLLTGNAAHGGLQASAETPYGQKAGAGLGGGVDGGGFSAGGLYAGATAGNGVAAGAGLGGAVSNSGSIGTKTAFATTGVSGSATKTITQTKPVIVAPIYKEVEVQSYEEPTVVYKTKTKIRSRVRSRPHHLVRKYYTSYYEQPSVPYVEKHVSIVQPVVTKQKYVEKQYVSAPSVHSGGASASFSASASVGGSSGGFVQKYVPSNEKEVVVERIVKPNKEPEPIIEEEEIEQQTPTVVEVSLSGSEANVQSGTVVSGGKVISSSSAVSTSSSGGGLGHSGSLGYSTSFSTNGGGQLIRDIFNIPISTLGAVSRLVSNAVGNTSFAVNKSFSTSYAG